MNFFAWLEGSKPIDRGLARTAVLLNLFATPGLGSLAARRWWAGAGQLFLAVAGFLSIMFWFARVMINYYSLMDGATPGPQPHWIGITGVLVFMIAWFWSLATSISLLREAERNANRPMQPPPLITT